SYTIIISLPPRALLFPYTTLFRSLLANDPANSASYTTFDFEIIKRFSKKWQMVTGGDVNQYKTWRFAVANGSDIQTDTTGRAQRSEEHTSELQSRVDLVCRLLLEK